MNALLFVHTKAGCCGKEKCLWKLMKFQQLDQLIKEQTVVVFVDYNQHILLDNCVASGADNCGDPRVINVCIQGL